MMRSHLIKPILDEEYKQISHGSGVYLYDTDGKKYLDGSSGAVTCSIGHGVKEVINAMHDQAKKVSFVYRSQFTNEPAERLAEKLAQLAPGDLNWSFFVNSGSEATETAMKIAIQYWQEKGKHQKSKILSRWMSYHGITIGSLSLSGHTERRARFVPLLDANPVISPPYCYRCPFDRTYPGCQLKCATELETAINRIGSDHIAAFVVEPLVGAAGGAIVPPAGYYEKIRDICDRNQILLIADEVMTGIGRTGKMFAMEHWSVQPDIIALGKGLSAGYTPIAATLVSDSIIEPILTGSKLIMSGHTYSANPQSAAVALAVLTYIEKHSLVEASHSKGIFLLNELQQFKKKFTIVGDVRGKGLLIGIEFVSNTNTKLPFKKDCKVTNLVIKQAQINGLLIYPSTAGIEGVSGDAILVAPPLTITETEMNELIYLLYKTIKEVEDSLQVPKNNPA
ncbi:aspartate aminotransferase family protein [Metabacillus herbersteinensis]|uniref:Aspartate aminotransferase family protein n=1 Tax=Metabacillus herbersteinensis TaxID=283816 RepID=A0ABV6GN67_9BACI